MSRPDKETALRLLAGRGKPVTLRASELVEDADGMPAGVAVTETVGTLAISPEALGWTQEELDDPEVTK